MGNCRLQSSNYFNLNMKRVTFLQGGRDRHGIVKKDLSICWETAVIQLFQPYCSCPFLQGHKKRQGNSLKSRQNMTIYFVCACIFCMHLGNTDYFLMQMCVTDQKKSIFVHQPEKKYIMSWVHNCFVFLYMELPKEMHLKSTTLTNQNF